MHPLPQSRAYAVKLARVKLKTVLQQAETRHRWAFDTRVERILPLHLYRLRVDARRTSEHDSSKLRW